jgi:DNA-binding transcriptional regulator YiaG
MCDESQDQPQDERPEERQARERAQRIAREDQAAADFAAASQGGEPPEARALRESDFCTEHEAARYLGITSQTLIHWRTFSPPKGPPFVLVFRRARYPITLLQQWAADHPPYRTPAGQVRYPVNRRPEPETNLFDALREMAAERTQ